MLFAHLKRILRLGRLRLRGPRGAQFELRSQRCAEPSQVGQARRPAATAGRRMCSVSVDHRPVASVGYRSKAIGFNEAVAISPDSQPPATRAPLGRLLQQNLQKET